MTWQVIAKLPQADFILGSKEILSYITGAVTSELVQGLGRTSQGQRRPPGVVSSPDTREVDFRYSRGQPQAIFQLAYAEDVERGGRYDARSGAINVYKHPWNTEPMRTESTLMGSVYVFWADQIRIWQIEIDEGFSVDDLLASWGPLKKKRSAAKCTGSEGLREDLGRTCFCNP